MVEYLLSHGGTGLSSVTLDPAPKIPSHHCWLPHHPHPSKVPCLLPRQNTSLFKTKQMVCHIETQHWIVTSHLDPVHIDHSFWNATAQRAQKRDKEIKNRGLESDFANVGWQLLHGHPVLCESEKGLQCQDDLSHSLKEHIFLWTRALTWHAQHVLAGENGVVIVFVATPNTFSCAPTTNVKVLHKFGLFSTNWRRSILLLFFGTTKPWCRALLFLPTALLSGKEAIETRVSSDPPCRKDKEQ